MLALHQGAVGVSDFYPQRGAGELQRFLQDARKTLKKLDVDLQKGHDVLAGCEDRWAELYDEVVQQLEDEGQNVKGYSATLLTSTVRRRGGAEAWTNLRAAERVVKRLDKQVEMLEAQIRAAQSEGKIGV